MSAERDPGTRPHDPTRAPDPAPTRASAIPGSHDATGPGPGAEAPELRDEPVDDDVLTVAEAARLLRIGRNKLYELAGRNEIPHRRLGKQIRFSRAAIVQWLRSWSSQGAKEGQ